jgi:DNA-binding NarL/FixJ family response regulator
MLKLFAELSAAPPRLPGSTRETIPFQARLSPRESQIVQHVLLDEKERAIAAKLGISTHTVHTHLRRIYAKLGVSSRVELATRVCGEYALWGQQGNALCKLDVRSGWRRAA